MTQNTEDPQRSIPEVTMDMVSLSIERQCRTEISTAEFLRNTLETIAPKEAVRSFDEAHGEVGWAREEQWKLRMQALTTMILRRYPEDNELFAAIIDTLENNA